MEIKGFLVVKRDLFAFPAGVPLCRGFGLAVTVRGTAALRTRPHKILLAGDQPPYSKVVTSSTESSELAKAPNTDPVRDHNKKVKAKSRRAGCLPPAAVPTQSPQQGKGHIAPEQRSDERAPLGDP